jgi:hypothetical protein
MRDDSRRGPDRAPGRSLQLLEARSRIQPELVGEAPLRRAVDVQRPRLPPRPVERQHQLSDQSFPVRLLPHQSLELRDQVRPPTDGQVGAIRFPSTESRRSSRRSTSGPANGS